MQQIVVLWANVLLNGRLGIFVITRSLTEIQESSTIIVPRHRFQAIDRSNLVEPSLHSDSPVEVAQKSQGTIDSEYDQYNKATSQNSGPFHLASGFRLSSLD